MNDNNLLAEITNGCGMLIGHPIPPIQYLEAVAGIGTDHNSLLFAKSFQVGMVHAKFRMAVDAIVIGLKLFS